MTCEAFDRWLDDGAPETGAAEARAHARTCARCARALDAMLEVEAALASTPVAPHGFTDRVMARVAITPQKTAAPQVAAGALAAPLLPPAFPWWVRIAMEPAVLLAAVLAALFVRFGAPILAGASRMEAWLAHVQAPVTFHAPVDAPWTAALFLLPALAWASWQIYRWSEALASKGAASFRGTRPS